MVTSQLQLDPSLAFWDTPINIGIKCTGWTICRYVVTDATYHSD